METIGKIIKGLFTIILMVICGCVGINILMTQFADQYIEKASEQSVQAILVLGAHVTPQKRPSDILADRLDTAVKLYKDGVAPKILVSGDHSSLYYNEVGVMKAYLVENGVPDKDIVMDHAGFSTYDSVVRAKLIFGIDKMVITTQSYHLKRAVYVARKIGIDAYGVSANKREYENISKYRTREFFARIKDFVYVHVTKPNPVQLGEPNYLDQESALAVYTN